ncbi:C1 family peptidase [Chryseobacterium kwangjuense]|uniref:C1 family peptidase n=1 Tax=Chryseobacterium kwangjuense TaxID=267125 RepID=A0ABW9K6J7_9FLAO
MKNFKIISVGLILLSMASCSKNDEEPVTQQEAFIGSMGAKFVDEATYNSFEKTDINELSLKIKGLNAQSANKALPSTYTISGSVVGDQGSEGSCTAWATAYAAFSILEYNFRGITQPRSPEYVYNQTKLGNECNSGSLISVALNLLKNEGACSFAEMPHDNTQCSIQPTTAQKSAANSHKLVKWSTVSNSNIYGLKNVISMNIPVIIAITLDEEFKNLNNTGWILKKRSGKILGAHSLCVIGYDDNKQAFKVQNSWGTSWGNNGYFWIDYDLFKNTSSGGDRLVNESYIAFVQ